jgi:hypothetical protein
MKKCFCIMELGSPHEWSQRFIDHLRIQEQYGWYWKIFTPNIYQAGTNVEIVPMTVEQFNDLTERKLGVRSTLTITEKGIPSFHVTDFVVMIGAIFEDYLKDFEFWGTMGIDNLVGRLDHFIPDSALEKTDIWSDEIGGINGNFCLFRNTEHINNIFKKIDGWEAAVRQPPCLGCTENGTHRLFGTDEYLLSNLMEDIVEKKEARVTYPKHFLIHSHERLEIHRPLPKLNRFDDGTLWELIRDPSPPEWQYKHEYFGREIAYFHFSQTKRWAI